MPTIKDPNNLDFKIKKSTSDDAAAIVSLVNQESERSGAVLRISKDEAIKWIANGTSLVAKDVYGCIVGHISANVWPASGYIELRSFVVNPSFRKKGIGIRLVINMLKSIKKRYGDRQIISFTNKFGSGKRILTANGFKPFDYEKVPKELFSIGMPHRGKKEHGYMVFVLKCSNAKSKLNNFGG